MPRPMTTISPARPAPWILPRRPFRQLGASCLYLTPVLELTDENARSDAGSPVHAGIDPPAARPRPRRGWFLKVRTQHSESRKRKARQCSPLLPTPLQALSTTISYLC